MRALAATVLAICSASTLVVLTVGVPVGEMVAVTTTFLPTTTSSAPPTVGSLPVASAPADVPPAPVPAASTQAKTHVTPLPQQTRVTPLGTQPPGTVSYVPPPVDLAENPPTDLTDLELIQQYLGATSLTSVAPRPADVPIDNWQPASDTPAPVISVTPPLEQGETFGVNLPPPGMGYATPAVGTIYGPGWTPPLVGPGLGYERLADGGVMIVSR